MRTGAERTQYQTRPYVSTEGQEPLRWYAFTARPGRKPLRQLGATSTGAEHTQLCEHRSAGTTTLMERISAGACSPEPVNGYLR
jgi:hypothetical protein